MLLLFQQVLSLLFSEGPRTPLGGFAEERFRQEPKSKSARKSGPQLAMLVNPPPTIRQPFLEKSCLLVVISFWQALELH